MCRRHYACSIEHPAESILNSVIYCIESVGGGKYVYAVFKYVLMCEQIRNTRLEISIRPNPRLKRCFLTWWERVGASMNGRLLQCRRNRVKRLKNVTISLEIF